MTRPFSLTMQAHRLDLHRLWITLLVLSILLCLGWAAWIFSDHVVVYETSQSADAIGLFWRMQSVADKTAAAAKM